LGSGKGEEMGSNKDQECLLSKGLPKWPGMLVVGEKVTREQAEEIIVRTSDLYFWCNEHEFVAQLYEVLGISLQEGFNSFPEDEDLRRVQEELGVITTLHYLGTRRIVSAWIGGPHGWCDWEGNIGSRNYNLGKWPSPSSVFEDWEKIAAAFPFPSLRCQLLDKEIGEDPPHAALVEYVVSEGRVEVIEPGELLTTPEPGDPLDWIRNRDERGTTIENFRAVIGRLRAKRNTGVAGRFRRIAANLEEQGD
jgi:hypothetical protein